MKDAQANCESDPVGNDERYEIEHQGKPIGLIGALAKHDDDDGEESQSQSQPHPDDNRGSGAVTFARLLNYRSVRHTSYANSYFRSRTVVESDLGYWM